MSRASWRTASANANRPSAAEESCQCMPRHLSGFQRFSDASAELRESLLKCEGISVWVSRHFKAFGEVSVGFPEIFSDFRGHSGMFEVGFIGVSMHFMALGCVWVLQNITGEFQGAFRWIQGCSRRGMDFLGGF